MSEELRQALDDEHTDYIKHQRVLLAEALRDAIGDTGNAVHRVRHLSSDQVYDIEYAEGNGDVLRLLEMAMSMLAGAQALAERLDR